MRAAGGAVPATPGREAQQAPEGFRASHMQTVQQPPVGFSRTVTRLGDDFGGGFE